MISTLLTIVVLLSFFVFHTPVFAQSTTPIPTPTPEPIDYTLPYPGLLPDNPLYTAKVIRDRIVSFLISDPLKKAEFNLLQADKRLNATVYLLEKKKNKEDLAVSTLSKGENYFEEALGSLREAKKRGMDVNSMITKLRNASKKHTQVIGDLKKKTSKNTRVRLETIEKRISGFEKEVDRISLDQ